MQVRNLIGTVLILLALTLHLAAQSEAASPVANQSMSNQVYGALWEQGNGQNTTLLLKNVGPANQANVSVVLYSPDGRQEQVSQLNLKGNSVSRLSLGNLVQTTNQTHWGGLAVQSTDPVQGQLVIADAQNGAVRYLPLAGGNPFDTENALHASWWLPDSGSQGSVTLFNSSSQAITVSVSAVTEGTSGKEQAVGTIGLAPFSSDKLDLRQDLLSKNTNTAKAAMGSLVLHYSGVPHALQPSLSIANVKTGFLLQPVFQAKHDATGVSATVTWQFPAISLENPAAGGADGTEPMTGYVLLSNAAKVQIEPNLIAYYGETGVREGVAAPLSVAALQPGEVRLINLSQFISSGLPSGLTHMALTISYDGVPGDLAATVFAANQSMNVSQMFPGAIRPSGEAGTTFWDVSVHPVILPTMTNLTAERGGSTVQPTLYYLDAWGIGAYDLPAVDVASARSLGLRSAVLSGIPDENGNRIPSSAKFGLVTLRAVESRPNDGNLPGVSTEANTASSSNQKPSINSSSANIVLTPHPDPIVNQSCSSPPPPSSCHANVQSFMNAHQADAAQVAAQLGVPVQDILGLAGQESAWGTSSIAVNDNNFFGQHGGAPGESGTTKTSKGVSVAVFSSFAASAQSFATAFGSLVQGKADPAAFAQALIPKFNSGKAPGGNPNFANVVKGAIQSVINCQ